MARPGRRKRAESRYAEQAERLAARCRTLCEQRGMTHEQLAARAEIRGHSAEHRKSGRGGAVPLHRARHGPGPGHIDRGRRHVAAARTRDSCKRS